MMEEVKLIIPGWFEFLHWFYIIVTMEAPLAKYSQSQGAVRVNNSLTDFKLAF